VDGVRLEAAWLGPAPADAPTLVFLHEGLGSVSTWRGFPARLAAAAGCGALVYSRAGYGASDAVPLPRGVDFMHREADVLAGVLRAARVRRAALVGHSDGASIALLHAAGHPGGVVRGLVLEAPHVFVEDVSVASIAAIGEAYRTTGLRARLARHHGANVDVAFRGWNDVWLSPAFRAWDITAALPQVRVPALVVQGTADEYGTWAQVEAIERGLGAAVETVAVPGCGHAPHHERPDAVLDAAVPFLRRVLETAPAE
jgi:pimeloyl-ACP methyl ester carboxylesterase